MKVLLRHFNGEDYVWKDAEFDGRFITVNGVRVVYTNIVYIMNDNRTNYVRCSACGEVFEKGSPEIEKHKNRYKSTDTCLSCRKHHLRNVTTRGTDYEHIGGGRFKVVTEQECDIVCTYTRWSNYPKIGSERARNECRYRRCGDATYDVIEDIFTEHPDVFEDIITVDKILEVGYKNISAIGAGGHCRYQLHGKNRIYAYVNSLSIVDHFEVKYYNDTWNVVYSKKLDKLFYSSGSHYVEFGPGNMSEEVVNYIKNKIAELYA